LQTDQTTVLSENINQTEPQTDTPTDLQIILAGKKVPMEGRSLSNESIE
jgi:hypothetical protein